MKIVNVVLTKCISGFYFDDQIAIKQGCASDGFMYNGNAVTSGFKYIRNPGEGISIQLISDDQFIAIGDCVAVQYSGVGGRDPIFEINESISLINEFIVPILIGEELNSFRELSEKYDKLLVNSKRLHTAIRYGITQAILVAVAHAKKKSMVEVIREEYNIKDLPLERIPILSQSGDERYLNVDKMILKEVDALPHALINNVDKKLGREGEILIEYLQWLKNRILKYRRHNDYNPVIHIDTYGTIGDAFNYDVQKMVAYIKNLEEIVSPFKLRIEGPVDASSREETMLILKEMTDILNKESSVKLVADEWCNSLEDIKEFASKKAVDMIQIKAPDLGGINNICEAILFCNKCGVDAYCGGSCNETDISSRITTNIAMACGAKLILAKPGMGCDEGYMICKNEMNRILAIHKEEKKV